MKLKYQTRAEMPVPSNPLQGLSEMLSTTSRDCGEDRLIAAIYGVVCGWDDESYKQLAVQHNWSKENINVLKMWHKNFNECWNLFYDKEQNKITLEKLKEHCLLLKKHNPRLIGIGVNQLNSAFNLKLKITDFYKLSDELNLKVHKGKFWYFDDIFSSEND